MLTDPASQGSLRRVLRHVDQNLGGDLSVAALARVAGQSASCFARWFRAQTSVSPHAYVLRARLERAMRLLRETDRPLAEVALAVGFSSQACLSVAFKRGAGVTPRHYRALNSRKAKDGAGRLRNPRGTRRNAR